ncbi:hypothetical protein PBRA_002325 [Plasmodiophora brassicae]|uniref:Uncharacterized protein n=1 Tax=Plasmodiophora brassicae TaxID=37360 RepID=A0A0G4J3A2_PLABS|nr:hypothetical protein PBRA_002325 [Plasmodiophora brassicae]
MGRPRFSRAWIDRLRALDGVVYVKKLRGEDLTDVRFSSITSDGYRAYVDKVAEIPGDPTLDPLVAPQAVFLQGVPMAAQAARMHEASQIIDEARFWRVDHIQGGVPPIPLPVRSGIPQGSGFHVHHASVAVSALNHAICNPGPATPVLLALAQGDYICSLLHAWSNVVFSFPLHRQ